jgi:cytochrome c-type biogenesis protein CcmH
MRAATYFLSLLVLISGGAQTASAQTAKPVGDDPLIEERLNKLSHELRCFVCQNETLADSRAEFAQDLRREMREQMKAGKSDQEIINFLTQRYGQFILYRPQVTPTTYLLWFGPFVLLLAGLAVLFRYIKQRRDLITETPLTDSERQKVQELLATGKEEA